MDNEPSETYCSAVWTLEVYTPGCQCGHTLWRYCEALVHGSWCCLLFWLLLAYCFSICLSRTKYSPYVTCCLFYLYKNSSHKRLGPHITTKCLTFLFLQGHFSLQFDPVQLSCLGIFWGSTGRIDCCSDQVFILMSTILTFSHITST